LTILDTADPRIASLAHHRRMASGGSEFTMQATNTMNGHVAAGSHANAPGSHLKFGETRYDS